MLFRPLLGNNDRMKFSRESGSAITIRQVERGRIRVGEETITEPVVLFRETVRRGVVAGDFSQLTIDNIADLVAESPEIIIVGAGWQPGLPPRELVFALARKGIGFELMDTPAACRTFNILVSEGRDAALVLSPG